MIFFGVMLLLCGVVRYFQIGSIDFETGFFTGGGFFSALFYILAVAAFAGFIFTGIKSKKKPGFFSRINSRISLNQSVYCGAASAAAAVSFLLQSVLLFSVHPVQAVFAIAAAFGFGAVALSLLKNKRVMPYAGYSMLLLAAYNMIIAAMQFNTHFVIKRMSSSLICLIADILLVFFFLGMGRVFTRTEDKRTRVKTFAFGGTAAIIIISESLAFWLYIAVHGSAAALVNNSENILKVEIPTVTFFIQGLAVLTLILLIGRRPVARIKAAAGSEPGDSSL